MKTTSDTCLNKTIIDFYPGTCADHKIAINMVIRVHNTEMCPQRSVTPTTTQIK